MNHAGLATQIVEVILQRLEQTTDLAWEDAEQREIAKREAVWGVEVLLATWRVQESQEAQP